ncbi:MAG: hypothetical protein JWQ35_1095 [Bacteriovoracaceae bacterium]|nr:hypothetical protein [Bacteriovoracaceae bacterium]
MKNLLTISTALMILGMFACGKSSPSSPAVSAPTVNSQVNQGDQAAGTLPTGAFVLSETVCTEGNVKQTAKEKFNGENIQLDISGEELVSTTTHENSKCARIEKMKIEPVSATEVKLKGFKRECQNCNSGECQPKEASTKIRNTGFKFDGTVLSIFEHNTHSCELPNALLSKNFKRK